MSEFRNTRPDSPKGRIFIAFQKKGEKAARALAAKLDVPNVRVNRWLKDGGAGFQGANDANKARKEKEAAPKKNGKAPVKTAAKGKASTKAPAKKASTKAPAKKTGARKQRQAEDRVAA